MPKEKFCQKNSHKKNFATKIFARKQFTKNTEFLPEKNFVKKNRNLLNNLILLSNLLISVEILGNYDSKTNQWVLTSKQLNLVCFKSSSPKHCILANLRISERYLYANVICNVS